MHPGQRETGSGMVKGSVKPVVCIVAHLAVYGIHLSLMVLCTIVLYLVARDAIGFGIEYGSLVARGALGNNRMSAG